MAGFTWNYFVDEVVLKDTFVNKSEVELDNFDGMGNWVKHHWAPYWWVVKFDLVFHSGSPGTHVESAHKITFRISS